MFSGSVQFGQLNQSNRDFVDSTTQPVRVEPGFGSVPAVEPDLKIGFFYKLVVPLKMWYFVQSCGKL